MKSCIKCKTELENAAAFCGSCGEKQSESLTCPKCSYPNEANSKFCQECSFDLIGSRNTKSPVVEPSADTRGLPGPGICVEFLYSSSASFDFAVEEARKLSTFEMIGADKKAIYRVTASADQISDLLPLSEYLKGWRKKSVYVDGVKTPWDSVFYFAGCYEGKKSSYRPQFYCLGYENEWEINLWGCKQAFLPWRPNSEFWTWGEWVGRNGDWRFDKDRLRHELEKRLFNVRWCPALNTSMVNAVISAIPDVVNPFGGDRGWTFVQAFYEDPRPSIKVSIERDGWKEEVFAVGACPKGNIVLSEIARKVGMQLPSF